MWPMLIPHDIYWPKINEKPTKKHHDMHKHVGLSENDTKNAKKWNNFLGSNGLVSAPTFSKFSQHTIMILYSRIFAFFCIALDALRTRGVRYIDKPYRLSIYRHVLKISISIRSLLKISISISISIRTFWKISISIRTFLKISISISISIRSF